MNNVKITLTPSFSDLIFFIFASNKDNHKSLNEFDFQLQPTASTELAALEHLK